MSRPLWLFVLYLGWGTATAGEPARAVTEAPAPRGVVATPLRSLGKVRFSENDWFAWVHPARCDADGNVFVMSVPAEDARQTHGRAAAVAQHDILRIRADGQRRTLFTPARIPGFADTGGVSTAGLALGPDGTPFALVWTPRGAVSGTQAIVSFRESGAYRSHVEIDDDFGVQRFEVFGSGEFLLQGVRFGGASRVAIMPARGGRLRDVVFPPEPGSEEPASPRLPSTHLTRGGDGRIYFVPDGEEGIHLIASSGFGEHAFRLAPVPPRWRLVDLKASGTRLALVYHDERADKATTWIVVYDVRRGERLAVYGPATGGIPTCYEQVGPQDRFTMLKEGRYLERLAPSF